MHPKTRIRPRTESDVRQFMAHYSCHNYPVLAVHNLSKRFGARWIFRGLEFSLSAGQSLVVLGGNGSGKSTLLKVLAGLIGPTTGTVEGPAGDKRCRLGYAALDLGLYPMLSAREHLTLMAKLRGCDPREDELLERFGMTGYADRVTREMSTGMRNRVKLALSIQARPDVLMLDEPGAALDEAGRTLVDGVVTEQIQRGVLIIASNDPLERRFATDELDLG